MKRLLKTWLLMAKMAILSELLSPWAALLFIIGKLVRFGFFFVFLFSVLSKAGGLAGYSREQTILFFLVFNLIDIVIQFLFRGVYHFRPLVVSGDYDLDLLKPLPSFFRPLFGHVDIMDFVTLPPLVIFMVFFAAKNNLINNFLDVFLFFILFFASLFIGFAFHLFICAVCILTTEIDHLVWVYRDLTAMARFPTDIYRGLVRFVLTFVFPVVLLIAFPAKGLMGLLSFDRIVLAILISVLSVYLSLKFWYWSLKRYTSASS